MSASQRLRLLMYTIRRDAVCSAAISCVLNPIADIKVQHLHSDKPSDPERYVISARFTPTLLRSVLLSFFLFFDFLHPLTSQYMYEPTDG